MESTPSVEWGTVRVHTSDVRPDIDYKTLFINTATASTDVIGQLLHKFRLDHHNAQLYSLVMLVKTRADGNVLIFFSKDVCSQAARSTRPTSSWTANRVHSPYNNANRVARVNSLCVHSPPTPVDSSESMTHVSTP